MILLFAIFYLLDMILISSELKHIYEEKAEESGMIPKWTVILGLKLLCIILNCICFLFVFVTLVKYFL